MSTHNGYVKEFPFVRIDCFTSIPNPSTGLHPLYHFLTHAHTDHLVGLNSPAFRGAIYMTPVTKMLVANTMEAAERVRWQEFGGDRIKKPVRKFDNLFKVRAGSNAKAGTNAGGQGRGMDQIREINLNQPIKLRGPNEGDWVKVTAIDANHCPGSCMFLFEGVVDGTLRSCLVTGDLRAEPWYLTSLLHNPLLAPYTVRPPHTSKGKEKVRDGDRPVRVLDCIYLDTSNVLLNEELVTKEEAIDDLIRLLKGYPDDTTFFLNTWTWGYEDLLKGVYRAFGANAIHLDWYKHRIFTAPSIQNSDPLLATLGSLSPHFRNPLAPSNDPSPSLHLCSGSSASDEATASRSTRTPLKFHACERYWKCDEVWQDGRGCFTWSEEYLALRRPPLENSQVKRLVKPGSGEYLKEDGTIGIRVEEDGDEKAGSEEGRRVVYVNPVEMMKWNWEEYREITENKLEKARKCRERVKPGRQVKDLVDFPKSLLVPLARHSTLPELQRFVAIFRPKTLYPLTISTSDPRQPARDYLSMPSLLSSHLAEGGEARLRSEAKEYVKSLKRLRGVIATSSPEDPEASAEEEAKWLGVGEWEREMQKRGLNIEGGKEIVEEVLKWGIRDERPVVENGGVRDIEVGMVEVQELPSATSIGEGARKLTYGGDLSQLGNTLPTSSSLELLPSALSPPVRLSTPAKDPPRASPTITPFGRILRKSVTFAPSPTKSPELLLAASTVALKRTRSLPIPPPSPAQHAARPCPPSLPNPSNSTTSSNSENAPPPGRSPLNGPPKRQKRLPRTEEERKRERLILALQRTLQGKIGPNGDVVPFTAKERETLKRRERRLREEHRKEKGKGREPTEEEESESLTPREFGTVESSY